MNRKFIQVGKTKWAFYKIGQGTPIFLVHGIMGSVDYFLQTAEKLAGGCKRGQVPF